MCSNDNTDSFGAPRKGGLSQLLGRNVPPVVEAPQATGLASLFQPSARGPADRAVSITPSARGPRNRRGLER